MDKALRGCIKQAGDTTSSFHFDQLSQHCLVNFHLRYAINKSCSTQLSSRAYINYNCKDHQLLLDAVIFNAHYLHGFLLLFESQT